jgi:hypothetical protein
MKMHTSFELQVKFEPDAKWCRINSFDTLESAQAAVRRARERNKPGLHDVGGVSVRVTDEKQIAYRICMVETTRRVSVISE